MAILTIYNNINRDWFYNKTLFSLLINPKNQLKMKTTKSTLVFITTFVLGYFFLSLFGCMFFDSEGNHFKFDYILGQPAWTMIYSICIGWWLAGMIAQDYYHNLEYKERKEKNAYN